MNFENRYTNWIKCIASKYTAFTVNKGSRVKKIERIKALRANK